MFIERLLCSRHSRAGAINHEHKRHKSLPAWTFSGRFSPGPWVSGPQTARCSQPRAARAAATSGRSRPPAWAAPLPARARVYIGAQLPRSRRPPVISRRFLPRRRGSAFLRLEQQLSLRGRLGRGQRGAAASPAGPPKGVRRLGLRFLRPGQRGGAGAQRI